MRLNHASALLAATGVIAGMFLVPGPVYACSIPCPQHSRPDEKVFEFAPAVFSGTVIELQFGSQARLRVDKVYKGRVGPFVVVASGQGADCRYAFKQGRKYLLFKAPDKTGRIERPAICFDPTTDLDADTAMVGWLRKRQQIPRQRDPSAPPLSGKAR